MTHVYHPDVHEYGLQDGCPRCNQLARDPSQLDDRMVAALFERLANDLLPRTDVEAVAMTVLRAMEEGANRFYRMRELAS